VTDRVEKERRARKRDKDKDIVISLTFFERISLIFVNRYLSLSNYNEPNILYNFFQ